jgi:hypothetical protein
VAQQSNDLKDNLAVPYHKRIAMGANLDGTSLQSKGSGQKSPEKKGGALGTVKTKK